MLSWLLPFGILTAPLFIILAGDRKPALQWAALAIGSVASTLLLLSAALFAIHADGLAFGVPAPSVSIAEAAEVSRGRPHHGALLAILLDVFWWIGPYGNAALWGGLGGMILRSVLTGSYRRLPELLD